MHRSGWIALGVALVLALVALAAPNFIEWCASPESCSAEARTRAAEQSAEGRDEAARDTLLRAHARRPEAALSAALSQRFEQDGEPTRALYFALDAHERAPGDAGHAVRAARLLRDVDPRRATRLLEEVLARDPDDVEALVAHSDLARSLGERERALAEARRLASPDQTDAKAWHHLGRLIKMEVHDILAAGRLPDDALFDEGIEALARATALEPDNWVARLERVWLLAVWPGHRDEATDAAWRAYRATFATVPADVLERSARGEMLSLARRLGDEALVRATQRAEPGAFEARRFGS